MDVQAQDARVLFQSNVQSWDQQSSTSPNLPEGLCIDTFVFFVILSDNFKCFQRFRYILLRY